MPVPQWETLTDFFDPDDFAITAVIELQSGHQITVSGIFDEPYLNATLGEYDMDTSEPRLWCRTSDVMDVNQGG